MALVPEHKKKNQKEKKFSLKKPPGNKGTFDLPPYLLTSTQLKLT